jgi:hypothetical protein
MTETPPEDDDAGDDEEARPPTPTPPPPDWFEVSAKFQAAGRPKPKPKAAYQHRYPRRGNPA